MSAVDLAHFTGPPAPAIAARSARGLAWRRLRANRVALAALGFIALVAVLAVVAPLIVKLLGIAPPNQRSPAALDSFGQPTGPSAQHLLGVDPLGRDVLSRVIYGARTSLAVALLATGISLALALVTGLLAGYYRGWTDTVLSRAMDVLLAFPVLLLAVGLASACSLGDGCAGGLLEPGRLLVVLVIALATWPYLARLVRGQVLALREQDFVEAARAVGAPDRRIMVREILPNLAGPLIVYASLAIPQNILFEAALSFLGVGVPAPDPSWGQMISDATAIFEQAWWYMAFPGLALVLTALAFNLLGDGLQDALDPRSAAR